MTSRLYINTFRHMAIDDFNRVIAAPMAPALSVAYVEITHESIVSDPFPRYTTFVELKATADCAISIGENPEADPNFDFIESGERIFRGVKAGDRIAVIEVSPELHTINDKVSEAEIETQKDDDGRTEQQKPA